MKSAGRRPNRKLVVATAIAALLVVVGAATAAIVGRTIMLRSGQCVTVAKTRICAAKATPRTVTVHAPAPVPSVPTAPSIVDSFLNLSGGDSTTRLTSFKAASTPPILHLVFNGALAANHALAITCHDYQAGSGTTFDITAAATWASLYVQLPTICDYYIGPWEVTIWMDNVPTTVHLDYTTTFSP